MEKTYNKKALTYEVAAKMVEAMRLEAIRRAARRAQRCVRAQQERVRSGASGIRGGVGEAVNLQIR